MTDPGTVVAVAQFAVTVGEPDANREAAGAGHEVLAEDGAPVLHELLSGFLRTGRPT